jgi:hypothetical protein
VSRTKSAAGRRVFGAGKPSIRSSPFPDFDPKSVVRTICEWIKSGSPEHQVTEIRNKVRWLFASWRSSIKMRPMWRAMEQFRTAIHCKAINADEIKGLWMQIIVYWRKNVLCITAPTTA